MSTQFYCKNKDRVKKVFASGKINGIDYLEVSTADQKTLKIFFLHILPGQTNGIPANGHILTKENIFIEGGVRVKNIVINKDVTLSENILTITVSEAGDFSTYTLKIGNSASDKETPPEGFDQQLSSIDFSFKVNCPNEFDCREEAICPPDNKEEPAIDYLAKDYASFNRLMLDRLSTIMPGWNERHVADLQIALIEMVAYVGDHLSYYQDAVATEAYMHTARRRISLKRHARLLDYYVHDGCNARVWVHLNVEKEKNAGDLVLKKGTRLLTNSSGDNCLIGTSDPDKIRNETSAIVFETMHDLILYGANSVISFYTWGDTNCCLPKGCTHATLLNDPTLVLREGDVLIFEEQYSPVNGKKADADPAHRHPVRLKTVHAFNADKKPLRDFLTDKKIIEIEWYEEDAIPFSLCLTSPVENDDGLLNINEKSIALGNIVLADHGYTRPSEKLAPFSGSEKTYYPALPGGNHTVSVPYNHETVKAIPASKTTVQNPHEALHAVNLFDDQEPWAAKQELLGSDRFATEFVVETEQDGTSYLRFGDNQSGKKPLPGFHPSVSYRIGNGKKGNVGAESINNIISEVSGIIAVRNPMAASGGCDSETMEEIRQFAPYAFRKQERAVTESDYVEKTELHPEVQKAAAKFYWTGSWYTVNIIIDRIGGKEIDTSFKETIRKHLEQYRMAGYDLEIRAPRFVPLYITMKVCVKEGCFRTEIKKRLLQVFGNKTIANGAKGFFHPDNFTFGQPVYQSAIYEAAMNIYGITSVEITEFKRWAKKTQNSTSIHTIYQKRYSKFGSLVPIPFPIITGLKLLLPNSGMEIKDGVFKPSELEIIRLDNDPNFPENGQINFIMQGGL